MSARKAGQPDYIEPFGTVPRRSPAPLYFWAGLYLLWFIVVLALAAGWVGLK